jgi:hypothetical protein
MRRLFACLAAVAVVAATGGHATAAEQRHEGFAMFVTPARLHLSAADADGSHTFRVTNEGSVAFDVVTRVGELRQGADGSITQVAGDEASATTWLRVEPQRFTLEPGGEQAVEVAIDVPDVPEPGEKQLGITFTSPGSRAGNGSDNIVIDRSVGAQLLIGVPGDVERDLHVSGLELPFLLDSSAGPARVTAKVENRGNVTERFEEAGRLPLRVRGATAGEFEDFIVFPGNTREVKALWESPPMFCWCTARVSVINSAGDPVVATDRVLVLPIRLIVGVLLLAFGMRLMWRARRRRLNALLAAARAQGREEAMSAV